jgi:hypothetical protein
MAFTIELVENALLINDKKFEPFELQHLLKSSRNYEIITGYLTGKLNTLQELKNDYRLSFWVPLFNLLSNIENPGQNDQLVLDIIYHPEMFSYLQHFFSNWLAKYVFDNPDEQSFQAALNYFRKNGFNDSQIVTRFLFNDKIEFPKDFLGKDTPLKRFLTAELKKSKQLIIQSTPWYDVEWSAVYFQLLDEVRPDLAGGYAVKASIQQGKDEIIPFFIGYREGYYIPSIIDNVRDSRNLPDVTWQDRLATGIQLYESDEAYAGLVTELSYGYLNHYKENHTNEQYEPGFSVAEFKGSQWHYFAFSTCAFHFILKFDREKAISTLLDFQQQKIKLSYSLPVIVHYHLNHESLPFLQKAILQDALGIDYLKTTTMVLINKFDPPIYLPSLWSAVASKSKTFRDIIADLLMENDPEAETKAIALLEHKKSDARQTAARVLSYFSSETAQAAIIKVLNKESNDTARDILLETVADSLPKNVDIDFIHNMVDATRTRGKLNKPVEEWLNEEKLPPLYYTNGEPLNTDAIRFLLYRMGRIKTMRSDIEARLVINQIDKNKSADFALHLIKLFIDKGTKPEHKYLLAIAALLGDDAVVDKIRITVNKWIEDSRFKMAEYGVSALALQGNNKALRWVEWYSRKYRTKKANVGAAALAALEAAAEELNITTYELGDRIVPDFGFNGLFKHFTVNGESYRAFIDGNFKMVFFNDDNKKLKTLPAATSDELKEEFKAITKEVRDVVKGQSLRLEHYLVVQRQWTVKQWQQFFLNNPVMFIYATKLLWGVYDNNNVLKQCFYCQEDTTLVDEEDNEISLPGDAFIGIVHPLQLTPDALQLWNQKFFDLAIEPVFPQLNRPVYVLAQEDKPLTIVHKFEEAKTESGSIKGTLEKHGWQKGPAGDGGFIDSFSRGDYSGNIKAILEVEGVNVSGFDNDSDPVLGRLYFIDTTKEKNRWFNPPQDDKDERLISLGNLSEVFYSEVMAGVNAIKIKKADGAE